MSRQSRHGLLHLYKMRWPAIVPDDFSWVSFTHPPRTSGNPRKIGPKTTLQMFTGVYRVSAGKSECGDFKFMGIACIPTIPVIFYVKILCGLLISTLNYDFFFKFPYNFCGDFRIPAIPVKKFICNGDSPYFL